MTLITFESICNDEKFGTFIFARLFSSSFYMHDCDNNRAPLLVHSVDTKVVYAKFRSILPIHAKMIDVSSTTVKTTADEWYPYLIPRCIDLCIFFALLMRITSFLKVESHHAEAFGYLTALQLPLHFSNASTQ